MNNMNMEEISQPSNFVRNERFLYWILAVLSTISCMCRPDWNIVFALLSICILVRLYKDNAKYYSKILLHLLLMSILIDIIWMIVVLPAWNSESKNNKYWEDISTIHSFVTLFAFLELALKLVIGYYIFHNYTNNISHSVADLFSLSWVNKGNDDDLD